MTPSYSLAVPNSEHFKMQRRVKYRLKSKCQSNYANLKRYPVEFLTAGGGTGPCLYK